MIQNRHRCLASIRTRQDQAWPELLLPPPQQNEQENTDNTIILIDPVMQHHQNENNVGDTMLTVAEEEYLSRLGWNEIVECDYMQEDSEGLLPRCTDDFLQAFSEKGGVKFALWHTSSASSSSSNKNTDSWGNLWRAIDQGKEGESHLNAFVSLLTLGYNVICLPQKLTDQHDDEQEQEHSAIVRRKILEGLDLSDLDTPENMELSKARVTFTWYDEESYLKALELYSFVENRLVPDIAFQLGPFTATKNYWKQVDILLVLEQDDPVSVFNTMELTDDSTIRNYLLETPYGPTLDFRIVDWKDRLEIFSSNSSFFDKTSIELLSLGRVVITDRLYAAILAYLSGIPFIYLELPSSHQLADPLSVALGANALCRNETAGLWTRVSSLELAVQQAADFLSTYSIP